MTEWLDTPDFFGDDYDPALDRTRLRGQQRRVYDVLAAGGWYTLAEIADATGDPEASISGQFRLLRVATYQVERRRVSRRHATGQYEYKLNPARGSHIPVRSILKVRADFYEMYARLLADRLRELNPADDLLDCWDMEDYP